MTTTHQPSESARCVTGGCNAKVQYKRLGLCQKCRTRQLNRPCATLGCTRPACTRGLCHTCDARLRRRGIVPVRPSLVERFEAKVDRSGGPGACHLWTRACDKNTGYGQINIDGRCRNAHVVALEMKLGRPLLPGMQSLHTCDNRPCVNGEHLYEGTQKQNIADAIRRGRFVPPPPPSPLHPPPIKCGEASNTAVMTAEKVAQLRAQRVSTGRSYSSLAAEWGISVSTVAQIVTGRTWKEVQAS